MAPRTNQRQQRLPGLISDGAVKRCFSWDSARLTLTQDLFGRPLKPKMIAQRVPAVLGAVSATALQDGHDMIDERRELMRQCRPHKCESVDGPCVLPSDHMCGQLLGRADEMHPPGATAHLAGDLT